MLAEKRHGNTSRITRTILGKFAGPGRRPVLFSRIMSFIKILFVGVDNGTLSADKLDCA